jgi:hypothetical protein
MLQAFVFRQFFVFRRFYGIQRNLSFVVVMDSPAITLAQRRGAKTRLSFGEEYLALFGHFSFGYIVSVGVYLEQHIVGGVFVWVFVYDFVLKSGDGFFAGFVWWYLGGGNGTVFGYFDKSVYVIGGVHGANVIIFCLVYFISAVKKIFVDYGEK